MARRKRKPSSRGTAPRAQGVTHVGVAWYRPERWPLLRELASDLENIEERHDEWLRSAQETIATLESEGISVVRVPIDVQAAADWAARRSQPFDGKARSRYVSDLLRRQPDQGLESDR